MYMRELVACLDDYLRMTESEVLQDDGMVKRIEGKKSNKEQTRACSFAVPPLLSC